MIYMLTLKPPKTLGKARTSQKNTKHARAAARITPEIGQAPVPSHPGTKYPVRGTPSLRYIYIYIYAIFLEGFGAREVSKKLPGGHSSVLTE